MDYQLLAVLRQHKLRNTTGRQIVFHLLKAGPALTVRDLTAKTGAHLDTASLYRTLNLFRQLGIVQDVVIAGRRKIELTDAFTPHHHHVACRQCGQTINIHDEDFEHHIERLAKAHGFAHEAHSFEITGLCPNCRSTAGGRSAPVA